VGFESSNPNPIFPITLGFNDCYLIQDEGVMMIDGGALGEIGEFKKVIKNISMDPSDIKLLVVTHSHIDHIGSLNDIRGSLMLKLLSADLTENALKEENG